jgi:uncharacterized protein (TIGR03435 family)
MRRANYRSARWSSREATGNSGRSLPGPLSTARFTVDQTGLTGGFDVELTRVPDQVLPDATPDTSGPSIFSAAQEPLGLKLVPENDPVAIWWVDHLEEPSAN